VLELLLVLGTGTILASIVFAVVLPQYGLDQMGGHSNAWKGIFSAKNYLGNLALFFLTATVTYSPRTPFFRAARGSQIIFCLIAIAFSRAATAYMLTAVYIGYFVTVKSLHNLRKRDYFVVSFFLLVAFFSVTVVIVAWPDFLFTLLGKDVTLTGRTGIWSAVFDSIAKRPLLGYGYQAFWLGLQGESYRVILAVSWVLAQAQNGFLDVMLEMGAVGLTIVLLIFGFAFRDGVVCLFHSRDQTQLRAVEWYLAIVVLTLFYNLDESFLFEPKHLGSMMFLLACVGLKIEWLRLRMSR
jgi:exopolysaccharide production protein ExoQ